MTHSAAIPWLDSLSKAWLLRSPEAFAWGSEDIPSPDGFKQERKFYAVWASLRDALRHAGRGLSLDVVDHIIENAWYARNDPNPTLLRHLSHWAASVLQVDGGIPSLVANHHTTHAEQLERWRYVSLAIPYDLLIATLAEEAQRYSVALATPGVAHLLSRGVAETHLHFGAASRFSALWTAIVSLSFAQDTHVVGEVPFGSIEELRRRIYQASIVRLLMALYLRSGHAASIPFIQFLDHSADELAPQLCLGSARDLRDSFRAIGRSLGCATEECSVIPERTVALGLVSYGNYVVARKASERDGSAPRVPDMGDPMASLYPSPNHDILPEQLWMRASIQYFRKSQTNTDIFAPLFWQYQRVRCQVFSWLTQAPGTAGLSWFDEHYERINALDARHSSAHYEALALESSGVNLRSLEVRTTPRTKSAAVALGLAKAASRFAMPRGQSVPEVGVVLHFIKKRANPNPSKNLLGARYSDWFKEQWNDASSVGDLLIEQPGLLVLLRGMDVANRELNIPNWVVLPLFRRLRDMSKIAARRLLRYAPNMQIPPMRATAHCGEDFRTLHEGIRRIYEMLAFDGLCEGDRIGHALALGIDPKRWGEKHKTVPQPRLERLDDLLWELDLYQQGAIAGTGGRILFVQNSIRELGEPLRLPLGADTENAVNRLLQLRRMLFDFAVLERLEFPKVSSRIPPTSSERHVLHRYLTDADVFEAGNDLVELTMNEDEVRFLINAQSFTKRLLAKREITVESNPSSNLVVGDFPSLSDLPALNLHPITPSNGECALHVTINDDDPITFATRLADEYAYLYAAMLRSSVASADALAWLERARDAGLRSRFTVEESAAHNVVADIDAVFQGKRQQVSRRG